MKKVLSLLMAAVACSTVFAAVTVPAYNIVSETDKGDYMLCKVNYKSAGADGVTPTDVSGIVCYPKNTDKTPAKAILMDNHFTITEDAEAPSNKTPELINNADYSMGGTYCFTSADYYGYGYTKNQPHTYLCQYQNAQNSIDLMIVARDIYTKKNVKIENDFFVNTGYSQGGGVTMAVHKMLEENKELADYLHFAGSFCGAGPYDLEATMLWYMEQTNINEPSLIPLVVKGLITGGYLNGYNFGQFFKFNTSTLESAIDSKTYSLSALSSIITSQTGGKRGASDILSADFMNAESQIHKDFISAARKNSLLEGWAPKYPMYLIHYEGDLIVPYVNTENAIAAFNMTDEFYHVGPKSLSSDHQDFAAYYYRFLYAGHLTEMINKAAHPEWYIQGVKNIQNAVMDGVRYNLLGMPVNENYQGIVILNGQKFIQ